MSDGIRDDIVVFIATRTLGTGDEGLGETLMTNFVRSLATAGARPGAILLMNGGVHLAAAGSQVAGDLALLYESGTAVISCGTCVKFFGLEQRMKAGSIGNMNEITARLLRAGRVIRP